MPAYKDEERNTWYCKFYYTDWTGEKKSKLKRGFKTKKEALSYEREFLAKLNCNDEITIGQLYEMYYEDKSLRVKATTLNNTRKNYNLFIRPYFENKIASSITASNVREWQNTLIKKGYAPTTLHLAHTNFSALLNYGRKYKGLTANPVSDAGTMGSEQTQKGLCFWTKEQFKEFIPTVKDYKYAFLYKTLYFSGMRLGELMALKINDILWDENILVIDENIEYAGKDVGHVTQPPKTLKSARKIVMPQFYMNELKEYVKRLYIDGDDTRLFYWLTNQNTIREHLKRDIAKTNLPYITPHDLRHSHVSLLLNNGASILLVSERLGHEKVSTTLNIYGHMFPSKQQELVDKLEEEFK